MAEWMVKIGRFDIGFADTSLNHFLEAPREGRLKQLVNIFFYLIYATVRQKNIFI